MNCLICLSDKSGNFVVFGAETARKTVKSEETGFGMGLTRRHPPMSHSADCLVIEASKVPDGQKETAALNFSKPPLHRRVKMWLLFGKNRR